MKKWLILYLARACFLIASLSVLSACGGGGGGGSNGPKYVVGGSLTGLASGASVVLLDNGSDTLTISNNGSFAFSVALPSGSSYAVTVGTEPSGQICSVSGGSGTIGTTNVTTIAVSCKNRTYTIGGTIQGLSNSGLVLANGSDTLKVPTNATSFTMPTTVTNGAAYSVTVQVNPTALSCTVINGAGTVTGADVTSISVDCQPGAESVLYSFRGGPTDGANPYGSLIQANDGELYGMTYLGGASGDGTVFRITSGGAETVLHSFSGTDGGNPQGSLIQASDGNFYGVTSDGGANGGSGVVFKITPGGTETVLHSFQGGSTDGAFPFGRLVQASDGNFYGMTLRGGTSNTGVVFKVTPGGTETILHSFQGGTTDGANPYGSLIQASDGNFYGMTNVGGANDYGVVFKITPGGTETVLHSFQGGTTDGALPQGNLIQASDGDLYGMTRAGGVGNGGTFFKITLGGTETVLYSFNGTDGDVPYGSLIQASDGNFYGTTAAGGANADGTLFKITPGGTETVLYSFNGGTTDGDQPYGSLIQASDGNFYGMTDIGGASDDGTVFEFN